MTNAFDVGFVPKNAQFYPILKSTLCPLEIFKKMSMMVSRILTEILKLGHFPDEIIETLDELPEVSRCHDFFDLLQLYKKTKSRRMKFEILRKIGLIVLLARIRRVFAVEDYDFALEKIRHAFTNGLGLMKLPDETYHLWLDESNKVVYTNDREQAVKLYEKDCKKNKFSR